ncbi:hypothetical protein GCM10010270_83240 [Streptomyces violaceus]|nr:hypothetical protein GCM10010270_83240 [Streptomyces janthinus]
MVEASNLHRTEAFVAHRKARLTVHGRRLLVKRVRSGRPVAHDRPGELVHVDVKKLGRIPDGGHKVLGRQAGRATRINMGFDYIHSAVDDHSRLAYSEIHSDEKADTCAGFLRRAAAFFAASGIDHIERPTTPGPTARASPGAKPWPTSARPASSPAPTGPRPTPRSNASTAPCSRSGPTCGPTPATPNAPTPWQTSCTPTTTTAATPHSAASHPSAVCTTLRLNIGVPSHDIGSSLSGLAGVGREAIGERDDEAAQFSGPLDDKRPVE